MNYRTFSLRMSLGVLLGAGLGSSACGGGGTDPGDDPAISLGVSSPSASVQQGNSTTVTGTLTRSGGFTGSVNLTVEVQNAPSGVTGTVGSIQTSGGTSTATITILVALSAPPGGPHTITVRATGSGVNDATASFQLTITAAVPSFSLTIVPPTLNLIQTLKDSVTITINRINFTAAVNLTAENLPAGVTAVFTPASTTGTSAKLVLTSTGGSIPGNYNVIVRGASPGAPAALLSGDPRADIADQTTTLPITIVAANVSADYTGCAAEDIPLWQAYQDGTGPWIRVTPIGSVFRFHISQSKGGVAEVISGGVALLKRAKLMRGRGTLALRAKGRATSALRANEVAAGYTTVVQYGSRDELLAFGGPQCPAPEVTKIVNGNFTGVDPSEYVYASMGGSTNSRGGSGAFQLPDVATGLQDFIAYKTPSAVQGAFFDRMVILRDQNFANNSTMPTVDLLSAPTPDNRLVSVTNAGTDDLEHSMHYLTGSCQPATLYVDSQVPSGMTSFYAYGPQAGLQRASDFHEIIIQATNADETSGRSLNQVFHSLNTQTTFRLPDPLPVPAVSAVAGPYKRLSASVMVPADYTGQPQNPLFLLFFYADEAGPNSIVIAASLAWLGGANAVVTMPDLSGLGEWQNGWAPAAAGPGFWLLSALHFTALNPCSEGFKIFLAARAGVY